MSKLVFKRRRQRLPKRKPRKARWTVFEENIMLALMCQGLAIDAEEADLADCFNQALNGGKHDGYIGDDRLRRRIFGESGGDDGDEQWIAAQEGNATQVPGQSDGNLAPDQSGESTQADPEKEEEEEEEENNNMNKKHKKEKAALPVRGIPRSREPEPGDKDPEEVARLLRHIIRTRPAMVSLIKRHGPKCVTRMQRMAFERAIRFEGTVEEWEKGRKEREMGKLRGRRADEQ